MKIKVYRLVTGEHIIGEVLDFATNAYITVKNPALFQLQQNKAGQTIIAITALLILSKNNETYIKETNVVYSYKPNNDLEGAYMKHTTGLDVAKTPDIII